MTVLTDKLAATLSEYRSNATTGQTRLNATDFARIELAKIELNRVSEQMQDTTLNPFNEIDSWRFKVGSVVEMMSEIIEGK